MTEFIQESSPAMSDFEHSFINKLTSPGFTFSEGKLQKELKQSENIKSIIDYINKTIIPNCVIDYSNYIESEDDIDQFQELKQLFINESIEIIKKLNIIVQKHLQMKPGEFVNIDTSISWYAGEETFLKNGDQNPFYDYKIISQILTIIFKLNDFINELYMKEAKYFDDKISYLKHLLDEKKEQLSPLEYMIFSFKINEMLEKLNKDSDTNNNDFKLFHEVTSTIRTYFLSLFSHMEFDRPKYLSHLPLCTLNVFRSSLYFLKEDFDFLYFIIKFEDWIPSTYRCNYLVEIMKLQNFNSDIKKCLSNFNPDINLLILDLTNLYNRLAKDPSIISDITMINRFLVYIFEKKKYIINLELDYLISFVSIQLTILSKIKSEKENISGEDVYEKLVKDSLMCIKYIIETDHEIIKSYLVHQIPTILLSFYEEEYKDRSLKECLDNIFLLLMENKHTIIYLSSTLDEESIKKIQIPLFGENKIKLDTWVQRYKKMNSFEDYDQLLDPITSSTIVVPCVIPMDVNGSMLQVCDKNMMMSCLWTKSENPFTRSSLTIKELEDFNKKDEAVDKLREFNAILKSAIEYSKI